MERNMDVNKLIKKARSSWWEDGIVEIYTGSGILLIGILGILSKTTSGIMAPIYTFSWVILLLLLTFLGQKFIRLLKKHLVWSKYGYAEPEKRRATLRNGKWAIGALICMLGAVILYTRPISTILISCFILAVFMGIFEYSGLSRFAIIGVINLIAGVILFLYGVKVDIGVFINLLLSGVLLFFSGLITWNKFRKRRVVNE